MEDRFASDAEITRLVTLAVRQAVLDHKRAGNPIAAWQDGKVVIIPPEQIVVPDEDTAQTAL